MTKQMLMYRAASFWTNAYAPELSMGMKTEEELRDIVDVEYEDIGDHVAAEIDAKANVGEPISFNTSQSTPLQSQTKRPQIQQTKAPF
jgi:hypothetical protein